LRREHATPALGIAVETGGVRDIASGAYPR
jgi:hypothetical protein